MKKEQECKIISAETIWLRLIARISRRERRRNEDIGVQFEVTVTDRIKGKRLKWFVHVKRIDSARLPVKTKITENRSRGRQR